MKQLVLTVTGMTCSGCEQRIEATLARLNGVVRSKADHRSGAVTVVINPAEASEDAVRASVTQAGYGVSR